MRGKLKAEDQVAKSKNNRFTIWKLTYSFGIYNQSGVKIVEVKGGTSERHLRMAQLAADAIETEFQW